MKTCNRCHETKALADFYARPRTRDGYGNQCRKCEIEQQAVRNSRTEVRAKRNAQDRARRRAKPVPATETRRQRLWTWYRITPERFEEMLTSQGGRCAIQACGATEPGGKGQWHIDHDHACCAGEKSCGECVRGLLCSRCNPMLGMARDNVAILIAAADYLIDNAALSALGAIGSV